MTFFVKSSAAVSILAVSMALSPSSYAQDATLTIGGRLMLDQHFVNIENNDGTDFNVTDSEVRRARLFASGKYGDSISYKFEFNHTTGSDLEVTDGFVQFAPKNQPFKVKLGHFKTHNSLEEEASSRFISTIERGGFTDAFELDRRLGVSVGTAADNYTLNVGVYGESINSDADNKNGFAVAARGTYAPINTAETTAHIGASWRYRDANDSQDLRYRQRPYAHALNSDNTDGVLPSGRIINAGVAAGVGERFASSDNFFAVEGLFIQNSFWAAGEYSLVEANGAGANPDASFNGGYIEAGYIIGGKKSYKTSGGSYDRMKVYQPFGSGGWGALALVARYDRLDLEDDIYLGQLDTVVLGADWLPTKQTRIRVNYFNSDADDGFADSAEGVVARVGFDF